MVRTYAKGLKKPTGLAGAWFAVLLAVPAAAQELTLHAAVREALSNNPSLKAVLEQKRLSFGQTRSTLRQYDPKLTLGGSLSHSDTPQVVPVIPSEADSMGLSAGLFAHLPSGTDLRFNVSGNRTELPGFPSPLNPYYENKAELSVVQPLLRGFLWFPDFKTIEVAELTVEAASLRMARAVEDFTLSLIETSLNLAFQGENARIQRASWEEARDFFERSKTKRAAGLQERSEVLQAESTLKLRQTERDESELGLREAADRLRILLGRETGTPPGTVVVEKDLPVPASFEEALRLAEEGRRDHQAAKKEMDLAELRYRVARSLELPQVNLTAGLGFASLESDWGGAFGSLGDHVSQRVGLEVEIPLLNLGAGGDKDVEKASYGIAKARWEAARQELLREVRAAWDRLELAEEKAVVSVEREKLETEKLADIERKYRDGRVTSRERLLHQDDALRAKVLSAAAVQERVLARARLLSVTGGLLKAFGVEEKALRDGRIEFAP